MEKLVNLAKAVADENIEGIRQAVLNAQKAMLGDNVVVKEAEKKLEDMEAEAERKAAAESAAAATHGASDSAR